MVKKVSRFPSEELEFRSKKAWDFARENHTREKFIEEYRKFVEKFLIYNK